MPNYFSLTRKSDPDAGPVDLVKIDQEMCEHFKVECHPTQWHHWWYDIIGLYLACGKTFDEIRELARSDKEKYTDPEEIKAFEHTIEIVDWLDQNFTTDAWFSRHR